MCSKIVYDIRKIEQKISLGGLYLGLSRKQFEILSLLTLVSDKISQRELAKKAGYSLGTVNGVLKELKSEHLVEDDQVTELGLAALKPYEVKKAVFIAAGFGSRLVPITLNTPKPLVRVKGKRIIDGLIDACLEAGIEEIYIVRGYLSEQFDQLLYKYPMIKFIENPLFNEANNISSALKAKDLLTNAYVFEADLLISNPKIITKYQYSSNFLAIPTEYTDDWCFTVKDGIIQEEKVGGRDCWQMVGISYWNEEDGRKLAEDIPHIFNSPGGKERYWEQVPLVYCKHRYQVAVRQCAFEDIVEIDTFRELQQIDKAYMI